MKRFGLFVVLVALSLATVAGAQMRNSNSYRTSRVQEAIINQALREALGSYHSLEAFMPTNVQVVRQLTQAADGGLGEFRIASSFKNCSCEVAIRRADIGGRTDVYSFATAAAKEWARQLSVCDAREIRELKARMDKAASIEAKQHLAALNALPAGNQLAASFGVIRLRGDVIGVDLIAETTDGAFRQEFRIDIPKDAASVEEGAKIAFRRAVKMLAERSIAKSTRK